VAIAYIDLLVMFPHSPFLEFLNASKARQLYIRQEGGSRKGRLKKRF
jgi:hypothetical protein